MYAIIKTGGKQVRVRKGEIVEVELIPGEKGSEVEFHDVVFLFDGATATVGMPHVANAVVKGKLLGETRGPKVDSLKYKPRKQEYRRFGHRQTYARVEITDIITKQHKHQ